MIFFLNLFKKKCYFISIVDSILKMSPVRCKKHGSRKRAQFSDIWAGQYVTFAKEKETGDIYAWGLNNYFQLGK